MRILCVGGGTGGSVTPLLAMTEALREREPSVDVRFAGTFRGPERSLCAAAHVRFQPIVSGKLQRYLTWHLVLQPILILIGFFQSLFLLVLWRPHVVVGAGSFVQVPVGVAAYALRIPIVLHQQDVRLGLANRLLRPFAARFTYALTGTEANRVPHAVHIGNPVRRLTLGQEPRERSLAVFHFTDERPTVLIMGGGTGSRAINDAVAASFDALVERSNVIHLTGMRPLTTLRSHERYHHATLLTDTMADALRIADVVVTRAGLGTLSELAALRKATIVLPLPGTHQEENAQYLESKGAIVVLRQEDDRLHTTLTRTIDALLDDAPRREALGTTLHALFPDGAAERLADIVCETIRP